MKMYCILLFILIITSAAGAQTAQDYFRTGEEHLRIYDYERAAAAFREALTLEPDNQNYLLSLGTTLFQFGVFDEAEPLLQQAHLSDTSAQLPLTALGSLYLAVKDYNNAFSVYNKLIGIDSSVAHYHHQLYKSLAGLQRYEDALIELQIAYNLNTKNYTVLSELTDLYFNLGYFLSSLRIAESGIAVYPGSSVLYKKKGDINYKLKEYASACADYNSAAVLGDSSASLFRNLGLSHFLNGSIDSALSALFFSFELNGQDPITAFYLGLSYKQKEQPDSAVHYLRASHELQQTNMYGETYLHLASSLQMTGDYQNAVKYYNAAAFEMPARKDIFFHLAAVYDSFYDDKKPALAYYKRYLKEHENPDSLLVSYAEDRIEYINEKLHFNK